MLCTATLATTPKGDAVAPPLRERRVLCAANPVFPGPSGPFHPTGKLGGMSWKVTFQPSPKVRVNLHERNSRQPGT